MSTYIKYITLSLLIVIGAGGCDFLSDPPPIKEIVITLKNPSDDATVTTLTPRLEWDSSSPAANYHIVVDDNADFSSPLVNNDIITTTAYDIGTGTEELVNGTTYYWRVRGQNSVGQIGEWSSEWSFTVDTDATPIVVTLQSPAESSTVSTLTPTFEWNAVPDGTMYHLQIDDDSGFGSPILDKNDISSTSYTLSGTGGEILENDKTYYWRVRAQDGEGTWWDWSSEWDFNIDTLIQGIVGEWLFSGNANDTSGNANNGTVNDATLTTDRFGNTDSAYSFDGNNGTYIGFNNTLSVIDEITVQAWIFAEFDVTNPDAYPSWPGVRNIIRKGHSGNDTFLLYTAGKYLPQPQLQFQVFYSGGGNVSAQVDDLSTVINQNEWYHLVGTYKRNNSINLYINGIEVATNNVNDSAINNCDRNTVISTMSDWLQGEGSSNAETWIGKIDDVRIYNRALSVTEIQALYKEGGYIPEPSSLGLVAYYPFNGNANDESPNSNNGTVNGTTLTTDRFGNTDNAYSFDGVDDYIQLPAKYGGYTEFSVTAWCKPIGNGNSSWGGRIISNMGGWTNQSFYLTYKFTGTWVTTNNDCIVAAIELDYYENVKFAYSNANSVEKNNWSFVVLSFTNSKGLIDLYINGNMVYSIEENGTIDNPVYNARIGCRSDAVTENFDGIIDDIRIYNRALSETEIQALYEEGGWTGN